MQSIDHLSDDLIVAPKELSELGFGHPVTLTRNRARKRERNDQFGPPFIRLSPGRVGYRLGDVREWVRARTMVPSAA